MITANDFFMGIDNITVDNQYEENDFNIEDIEASIEDLRSQGITDAEIDELFNIEETTDDTTSNDASSKKKKKQSDIDTELVEEFIKNPTHDNFNKLWERFYFGIKGHAYKFMRDWDLADDMACQTFTRAWEFKDKYDNTKAKFSTWLYTICRNLCLGEINRVKKDNYVPNDISDLYDSTLLANNGTTAISDSTQYIVEQGNIVANSKDEILMMMYNSSLNEIRKIGGNYSRILEMKLVNDMKIHEIADELHMNESTVKNYLYKGKDMIQEIMRSKYRTLYDMYIDSNAAAANLWL